MKFGTRKRRKKRINVHSCFYPLQIVILIHSPCHHDNLNDTSVPEPAMSLPNGGYFVLLVSAVISSELRDKKKEDAVSRQHPPN
jgi:hypothetical protein